MSIHIAGAGSIGSLVATALATKVPPSYATLVFRNVRRLEKFEQLGSKLSLISNEAGTTRTLINKFPGIKGFPIDPRTGNPEMIDNLIVTSKAHQTLTTLEPLLPSIHRHTNILLLQNGMGVIDLLKEKLFPDVGSRPRILVGIATHGVYGVDRADPWKFDHVGRGKLILSEYPRDFGTKSATPLQVPHDHGHELTDSEAAVRSDQSHSHPLAHASSSAQSQAPTASEDNVKADMEDFNIHQLRAQTTKGSFPNVVATSFPTESEAGVKADYGPNPFVSQIQEENAIFDALLETGDRLNAEIVPFSDFLLAQYEKLVVNCVINPLTALLGCRNGELLRVPQFDLLLETIVAEASEVVKRKATSEYTPQSAYVISAALSTPRLSELTKEVIKLTANNRSSMLADVSNGKQTEIHALNGYIAYLGRRFGSDTDYNALLEHLIVGKSSVNRDRADDLLPFEPRIS